MDRNTWTKEEIVNKATVATREGGVDRNRWSAKPLQILLAVATREGGVDRNAQPMHSETAPNGRHPRGWRG